MRISDWSSDVCSSDLPHQGRQILFDQQRRVVEPLRRRQELAERRRDLHIEDQRQFCDLIGQEIARRALTLPYAAKADVGDRKSVVEGKSGSVRGEPGGRRVIKKKK